MLNRSVRMILKRFCIWQWGLHAALSYTTSFYCQVTAQLRSRTGNLQAVSDNLEMSTKTHGASLAPQSKIQLPGACLKWNPLDQSVSLIWLLSQLLQPQRYFHTDCKHNGQDKERCSDTNQSLMWVGFFKTWAYYFLLYLIAVFMATMTLANLLCVQDESMCVQTNLSGCGGRRTHSGINGSPLLGIAGRLALGNRCLQYIWLLHGFWRFEIRSSLAKHLCFTRPRPQHNSDFSEFCVLASHSSWGQVALVSNHVCLYWYRLVNAGTHRGQKRSLGSWSYSW